MRTRLAVSAQDGEAFMQDEAQRTCSSDLGGTGASWQELWLKHVEYWPTSATVALPHVYSNIADWIEVA
uniref:Polyketide synthase n=1 Tax=Peronospora matthiolae TaxID=2874970 RepID=A0AAV1VCC9_9STRA